MSLNLKDAKKGLSGPLAPIGNHISRCFQVIDLGTQDSLKYGNASHKLRFAWELCEEMHDFGKGKKEPFSVSMTVNFFFGRNSNFTKLLEGWKGGTFTDAELDNFELKKLVGKACMINVVHNTSGENDYANVASVSPVPAKWKDRVPALYNKSIYFETEMGPNSAEFKALPDFLQKMIEKCHEWRGGSGSPPSATPDDSESDPFAGDEPAPTDQTATAEASARGSIAPEDDDIPLLMITSNLIFQDVTHTLDTGMFLGMLVRAGIPVRPIYDERGNYTPQILISIDKNRYYLLTVEPASIEQLEKTP